MAVNVEEVKNEMIEVAADYVGIDPEQLDINKKLRLEYGVTSIEASELIMEMEDRFDLKIPIPDAQKILSTQDAIDYIIAHSDK